MEHFEKYASVITDLAIDKTLDYGVPPNFSEKVGKGVHVKVPLRGQIRNGIIFSIQNTTTCSSVLPLHDVLSDGELIDGQLFELALWMAKYYCTPLAKVLKVMLPKAVRAHMGQQEQYFVQRKQSKEMLQELAKELREKHPAQAEVLDCILKCKKGMLLSELLEKAKVSKSPIETLEKKGALTLSLVQIDRSPLADAEYFKSEPKVLKKEQREALLRIEHSLTSSRFETHLLFGVTGSGKTEVYLQAIDKALSLGKGSIMLVPEISLTAQTIERLRARFDEKIAILHHRLSQGERHDEWHRIRKNEAKVVVGARSALFSPVTNLGLIIVDEEHDMAYKQSEEMPCYHARDVAVMRSKIAHATIVLGTATPSLESYYNASSGKYSLSRLISRIERDLPHVTIIDMKKEYEKQKGYTSFSELLIEGIKKRLNSGEQTILFLNRRGYHTTLKCTQCSYTAKCPSCDLALTFHKSDNKLACHLCDYQLIPPPRTCPSCHQAEPLKYRGVGTEQIERSLHALFPGIRTLRIDGDTTRHKGSHETFFRAFSTGKSDVLIGTQMISKGLHFPGVTLVAILNSDGAMQIPDFRASEMAFQLMTQVAGRSGRGHLKGEVIIQTKMPENSTIELASKQDYEGFYAAEIESRKLFSYPPFTHLAKFVFIGADAHATEESGKRFRSALIPKLPKNYLIHPLVPAGHPKVNNNFYFQFLVRGMRVYSMTAEIDEVIRQAKIGKNVRLLIDIDPASTFF